MINGSRICCLSYAAIAILYAIYQQTEYSNMVSDYITLTESEHGLTPGLSPACRICKASWASGHSFFKSNCTYHTAITFIKGTCSLVGVQSEFCDELLDSYGTVVWRGLLRRVFDPDYRCWQAGLCYDHDYVKVDFEKLVEYHLAQRNQSHLHRGSRDRGAAKSNWETDGRKVLKML